MPTAKEVLTKSRSDFRYFVRHVFSKSFEHFVWGDYLETVSAFYNGSRKTMRIAPKDHFKSTSMYAFIMWQLIQPHREDFRVHYFSFEKSMAQYHVGKVREFVSRNPFFAGLRDLKMQAEGVAKYSWDGEYSFYVLPHGMMSFKRGIHDKLIIVDDPFQDPASKIEPKIITRINQIFITQIMDMVMTGGFLHVVGTPQTTVDFLFNKTLQEQYAFMSTPAVVDSARKKALWPEWMPWEELQKRKAARGEKIFNQEYNCRPAYAEQAFFKRDQLLRCIDVSLQNRLNVAEGDMTNRFAGWDIGKKAHPAHFTVLEEGGDGIFRQVYTAWFEGVDYIDQLKHVKEVCAALKVDILNYDDTRGELEALKEQGMVPDFFEGITFSLKQKHALAGALDALVSAKGDDGAPMPRIRFQNDERQLNQLQVVTNDLDAIETPEGHGDCFWSLALAAWGSSSGTKLVSLTGLDETTGYTRKSARGFFG